MKKEYIQPEVEEIQMEVISPLCMSLTEEAANGNSAEAGEFRIFFTDDDFTF